MNDDDESTNKKKKKVVGKLEAMSGASEEDRANYDSVFEKQRYEGTKGHLLLQLQKSYKGDERFQLKDDDFDIDLGKNKDPKKVLPQGMLDALTKKEEGLLKVEDEAPVKVRFFQINQSLVEEEQEKQSR